MPKSQIDMCKRFDLCEKQTEKQSGSCTILVSHGYKHQPDEVARKQSVTK